MAAAATPPQELLPGWPRGWAEAARRQLRAELAEVLAARSAAAEQDSDTAAAAPVVLVRELDPLTGAPPTWCGIAAASDRASTLIAGREVTASCAGPRCAAPAYCARRWLGPAADQARRSWLARLRAPAVRGRRGLRTRWRPGRRRGPGTDRWSDHRGVGIAWTRLVAELARRADNAGADRDERRGVDVGGEAPLAMWQELVAQLAHRAAAAGRWLGRQTLSKLAPDVRGWAGMGLPCGVVTELDGCGCSTDAALVGGPRPTGQCSGRRGRAPRRPG
jgi:hypothetical protein